MSFSTFSGPVRVGTVREGPDNNTGLVMLALTFDTGVVSGGVGNYDFRIGTLPQGARIFEISVSQIVVPGGTSTSTISLGSTAGGANLLNAQATTAGGTFAPSDAGTIAGELKWETLADAGDVPVFMRYAVGVAAGAGRATARIWYVQRSSDRRTNPDPLFA